MKTISTRLHDHLIVNILTFDVEEWFIHNDTLLIPREKWSELPSRVNAGVDSILGLLHEKKLKATFFIQGWIAEHHPVLVSQISNNGHDIGYHSYYHLRPARQSSAEFEEDIIKGLNLLQAITGKKVTKYRAPNLSINNETLWVYPILAKYGITVSSSVKEHVPLAGTNVGNGPFRVDTLYGTITEYPLNRLDLKIAKPVFSGSGYFRLLNYAAIKLLYKSSGYNMAYFHPRDFDAHVPVYKDFSMFTNWKNRVNTSATLSKLARLIDEVRFISLAEADQMYKQPLADSIIVHDITSNQTHASFTL